MTWLPWLSTFSRQKGPWSIGFQHDNVSAGKFWREIADTVFGPGRCVPLIVAIVHTASPTMAG